MHVLYRRKTRFSGRILERALRVSGYSGRPINYGYNIDDNAINGGGAIYRYSNKRLALQRLRDEGVPTPVIYTSPTLPCVARTDRHFGGSGFWLCRSLQDIRIAKARGATHFLEYIEGGREFRVHVAFDKSIKIAEKVGGSGIIKNHKRGWYFAYPQDFNHKITLRNTAKQAVSALGLDFGAVDIIYKDGKFYVLEVNSAPSLTSNSDVLERYVKAFKENNDEYYYD